MRALVLDDFRAMRSILTRTMGRPGFDVQAAGEPVTVDVIGDTPRLPGLV